MNKRTAAIAFLAAAICALLLANFVNSFGSSCFGGHGTASVPIPAPAYGLLWPIVQEHEAFCHSKETALGLEIAATILLALAVSAWTARGVPPGSR